MPKLREFRILGFHDSALPEIVRKAYDQAKRDHGYPDERIGSNERIGSISTDQLHNYMTGKRAIHACINCGDSFSCRKYDLPGTDKFWTRHCLCLECYEAIVAMEQLEK